MSVHALATQSGLLSGYIRENVFSIVKFVSVFKQNYKNYPSLHYAGQNA
jgi:hypothetical protein